MARMISSLISFSFPGYKVASTLRLGVFDINIYANYEKLLMLGYLSALFGKYTMEYDFNYSQKSVSQHQW